MSKWQQIVSGTSQRYSLMMTLKQWNPQLLLQRSQPSSHVRLNRIKPLGSPGDVSMASNGRKKIQIRELHNDHYTRWISFQTIISKDFRQMSICATVKSLTILGSDHPQTSTDRLTARTRSRSLFVVCFGFFLVLLDTTALNIATPALGKEFGDGISDLQWVVNSYTSVFASLLLTAERSGTESA